MREEVLRVQLSPTSSNMLPTSSSLLSLKGNFQLLGQRLRVAYCELCLRR